MHPQIDAAITAAQKRHLDAMENFAHAERRADEERRRLDRLVARRDALLAGGPPERAVAALDAAGKEREYALPLTPQVVRAVQILAVCCEMAVDAAERLLAAGPPNLAAEIVAAAASIPERLRAEEIQQVVGRVRAVVDRAAAAAPQAMKAPG